MLQLFDVGNAKLRQANLFIMILLVLVGGCSQESPSVVDTSKPGVYVMGAGDGVEIVIVDRKGRRGEHTAKVTTVSKEGGLPEGSQTLPKSMSGERYSVTVKGCPTLDAIAVGSDYECENCGSLPPEPKCPMDLVELDNLKWKIYF